MGLYSHAQDTNSEPVLSEALYAAAQRRIADCTRTLPILIPEASPMQIQQACQDKYGLEGSFVNACLSQVRQIYAAEGKPSFSNEISIRGQCSARERIKGITRQPFDAPEAPSATATSPAADAVSLIWPMAGDVIDAYKPYGDIGIGIKGSKGATVVAAAAGTVVGVGAGFFTSNNRMLINSESLTTAYIAFEKVFVKSGDTVSQGQKIAEMGDGETLFFKAWSRVGPNKNQREFDTLKAMPTR